MNKPLRAFLTLLALLFMYSIYQFFATHDYKEVTEYTPFKGEARENPLYAARLFIRHMGIPAENKNDLQSLGDNYPDIHTTLILDTSRTTLSLQKAEKLLDWVRRGGHLITRAHVDSELMGYFFVSEDEDGDEENDNEDEGKNAKKSDLPAENYCPDNSSDYFSDTITDFDDEEIYSKDPLQSVMGVLAVQGVYLSQQDDDNTENDNIGYEQLSLSSWRNYPNHVEFDVALEGVDKLLSLALDNYFYALYTPFEQADNSLEQEDSPEQEDNPPEKTSRILIQNEPFLLHRAMGKGHITLISDLSIFENQLLRYADNAEILWDLLHSDNRQPSAVWLFHNDEMPNLFSLMWKYGWMVVLSLGTLLLFWLYQSMQRFGPMIPRQELARRRLLEHIDASGRYFWKTGNKQLLINSTRRALNLRIAQLHPGWHNSDNAEKIQHLAELLDRPVEEIKKLLFTDNAEKDEDFIKLIDELETIRKHL